MQADIRTCTLLHAHSLILCQTRAPQRTTAGMNEWLSCHQHLQGSSQTFSVQLLLCAYTLLRSTAGHEQ